MRPVFMETGHDLVLPRFFDTGIQLEDSTQWICLIGIDSRLLEGYQCTRRLTNTSDHIRSSRTLPTDMEGAQMSSSALISVKRQLTAVSLVNGRIPTLQISSDVTLEEIEFRSADIEYTGYLAGPEPPLACQSRLWASPTPQSPSLTSRASSPDLLDRSRTFIQCPASILGSGMKSSCSCGLSLSSDRQL